jgi:hypothetical protein
MRAMRFLPPLLAVLFSTVAQAQAGTASVLILAGDADAARGPALLKEAREKLPATAPTLTLAPGFPQVVRSDGYQGLRPGFTIVIAGFCPPDAAGGPLEALKKVFPGAYVRKVTGVEPASCPKVTPALPDFDDALGTRREPACDSNWKGRVSSSQCTNQDRPGTDWFVDTHDILVQSRSSACGRERTRKKLSLTRCPGIGPELTDTAPCQDNVTTCLYPFGPGRIAVEHSHSQEGETTVSLRVYDVANQKRLTTEEWSNGCAIGFCEMGSIEDVDGDGLPEILFTNTRDRPERPERILKWKDGKFRDVGPFLWKGQPEPPATE